MEIYRRLELTKQHGNVISNSGAVHRLVIDETGALYACGDNEFGQLGTGDTENKLVLTRVVFNKAVKMASVGGNHTIIIDIEGAIYACGDNNCGQLGLGGDKEPRLTLVPIPFNEPVRSVIAGDCCTFVITKIGKPYACGKNADGSLGLGYVENDDGSVGAGDKSLLTSVPFDHAVREVILGGDHTLFLTEDGTLYGCGENSAGQLGIEGVDLIYDITLLSLEDKVVAVAAGDRHTLVLTEEGKIYTCGDNCSGQLGQDCEDQVQGFVPIPLKEPVKMICAGYEHSLIVTRSGKLYACGSNEAGQLGLSVTDESREVMTLVPFSEEVAMIAAGCDHSTIVTTAGKTYVCGTNSSGQLCLNDTDQRSALTLSSV